MRGRLACVRYCLQRYFFLGFAATASRVRVYDTRRYLLVKVVAKAFAGRGTFHKSRGSTTFILLSEFVFRTTSLPLSAEPTDASIARVEDVTYFQEDLPASCLRKRVSRL